MALFIHSQTDNSPASTLESDAPKIHKIRANVISSCSCSSHADIIETQQGSPQEELWASYICMASHTEPPNLNLPIFLQWRFGTQFPNLSPTSISGYMVPQMCPCCPEHPQQSDSV